MGSFPFPPPPPVPGSSSLPHEKIYRAKQVIAANLRFLIFIVSIFCDGISSTTKISSREPRNLYNE